MKQYKKQMFTLQEILLNRYLITHYDDRRLWVKSRMFIDYIFWLCIHHKDDILSKCMR
jgi:hypothetical protein